MALPIKKRSLFRGLFFAVILILILGVAFRAIYRPPMQSESRFVTDTYWVINVPGGPEKKAIIKKAFDRLEEIDKTFSISDPNGEVYGFNHLNKPIHNPDIIHVIKHAKGVYDLSGGMFDITVGPLLEAFGFYSKNFRVPSDAEVKQLLKYVGFNKYIVIHDNEVTKTDPHVVLDLGGIAKSFAVAEAVRVLKNNGVKNALVNGGGDLYAMGLYNGQPWRIGIEHPRKQGALLGNLEVTDMAVFSSGDYERYFFANGIRYHHIFDPRTGYSSRSGLIATTILYPDLKKVGGLSSTIFLLGKEKGLAFIESLPGAAGLVVTDKNEVFFSKTLAKNTRSAPAK